MMSEDEKMSHSIKGVAEDIYLALLTKEIATTTDFIKWCQYINKMQQKRVGRLKLQRPTERHSHGFQIPPGDTSDMRMRNCRISGLLRETSQTILRSYQILERLPNVTYVAQDIELTSKETKRRCTRPAYEAILCSKYSIWFYLEPNKSGTLSSKEELMPRKKGKENFSSFLLPLLKL
ncbi:hypothetical protein AVEN_138633-1 [Araneus ventricosus]|uniref:Uncharacterized protein n=1 Tax=Araneus ventricosus TaxID=182803 RepID=A0A4Y2E2L7_ARAVE|nr:hypothetical protein AVEN_138633-1 [Araneus ventricosus]